MLPSSPVQSGSLILATSQPHQEQQQQDGQQQHQQQLDEQSHHLEDFGEPKQENIEDILALLLQQGGGGGSDLGQTNGQDSYPNMTGVAPPPPPPPPNRKKASEHQLPTTNPSADQLQLLNFFDLADFDVSSLEELTAPAPSNNQMHHHQQQQQLQQSQPRLSTTTTTFSNGSQQPSHNSLTTTPADKFGSNNCNGGTVITSDGMEVDQDVADWLDSLLPTSQQGQEVGMDQEQSTSSGLIQHTGDTSAKNSLGCETNGNTILQCSSSDPLMTTMSGSSGITSSSASSLSFLADDTDMKNVEGGIWDKVS